MVPEVEAAEVEEIVPCPLRLRAAGLSLRERGGLPRAQPSWAQPGPQQGLLGLVRVDRAGLFGAVGGGPVREVPVGVLPVHLRLGLQAGSRRAVALVQPRGFRNAASVQNLAGLHLPL